MKKIKYTIVSLLIITAMFLTACTSIPSLTEEQEEMVSEYATALLLKYDSENHSRLVDTTPYKTEYETAVSQYESEKAAYYSAKQKEEDKRREETLAQENANSSTRPSHDGTGGATVIDKTDIESVLGLKDITITCTGFDITDIYPKTEKDLILTISGTKSADLLIIYLDVTNTAASSQTVDIASIQNPFKISVNGGGYALSLTTLVLEDDITTFNGTIGSGETRHLVLISEVKKGTTISKLNLRVTNKDKSATRVLK